MLALIGTVLLLTACVAGAQEPMIEIPPADLLEMAPNDFQRRGPEISAGDTWEALTSGENLALGRAYRFVREPNYAVTRDAGDATQLTDGEFAPGDRIWFSKQAVGWRGCEPPAMVVIDLGEVHAIDAVVARVQGGGSYQGGFRFPRRFDVYVSDDERTWHRVDSVSKRIYADQQGALYDLPESDDLFPAGEPYVHPFHFGDLQTRGRYVALQMWFSGSYHAIDEIAVMAGDHDPDTVEFDSAQQAELVLDGVELVYPLPWLQVPTNVAGGFTPMVRESREDLGGEVTFRFHVPAAVELSWLGEQEFARSDVQRDGQAYAEYLLTLKKPPNQLRWFYVQADSDDLAPMYFRAEWDGGAQPWQALPLRTIEIPQAPPLEHLIFALGWTGSAMQMNWPGQPEVLTHLGFTHASVGSWETPGTLANSEAAESQQWIDEVARPAGLKLVMTDSPWHIMQSLWGGEEDFEEAYMQSGEENRNLCVGYRGEYFQREVQRLVDRFRFRKPEVIFFDVECFGPAGRGLADCARCLRIARERGVESEELASDLFTEAATEIANALNAAADDLDIPRPKIGYYQCGVGWVYHNVLDFEKLYPEAAEIANPEFYGQLWPPGAAQDVRFHKPADPEIPIVLWTSPGTATWDGEAPPPWMFDATMEALFNGCSGQVYYTPWFLSPGDLQSQAHAAIIVAPVEDIISRAEIVEDVAVMTDTGHVSAIRSSGEMLVLAAEYEQMGPAEVTARVPVDGEVEVVDLLTREVIGRLSPEADTITARIEGAYRSRPFYVGTRWDERR
ncbi:MAG: discoidin domain-containing protein [Armatimonadota bacterium]